MEKDINELNLAYRNALQGYDIAITNIIEMIESGNKQISDEARSQIKKEMLKARESFVEGLFAEEKGELL